jgi:hypothetical protein
MYSIVAVKQAVETKEAGTVATPPASDVAVAEAAGGGEGRLWEGRAGGLSEVRAVGGESGALCLVPWCGLTLGTDGSKSLDLNEFWVNQYAHWALF